MTEHDESAPSGGLRVLLPALVLASAFGYAVQMLLPLTASPEVYVQISAFWGLLFLGVAAFSGVQNEVARSVAAARDPGVPGVLPRFAWTVAAVAAATAVVAGIVLSLLRPDAPAELFVPALAAGLVGYSSLATITGTFYGARRWRGAAVAAMADPAMRVLSVAALAVLGLVTSLKPDLVWLLAAVVLPFPAAFVMLLVIARRRAQPVFDRGVGGLIRGASHTTVAAVAMGLLVSGLPLVIGALGHDRSAAEVAGVVFVVVLARAPLVSPLLALQSYLTVRFTAAPGRVRREVAVLSAAIAVVSVVVAVIVVLLAPTFYAWFVPTYAVPPLWLIGVVVASAGLVAVQCVTGPAVLAAGRHRWYSSGWVATALLVVASLAVPAPFEVALALALCIAPIAGMAVHAVALRDPGKTVRRSDAQA